MVWKGFGSPGLAHPLMDSTFAAWCFVFSCTLLQAEGKFHYTMLENRNSNFLLSFFNSMLANISDDKSWWKVFWQPSTMWCSLLRQDWLYFFPIASSRFHGAAAGILNPENCRLTLNLFHWFHFINLYLLLLLSAPGVWRGNLFTYCPVHVIRSVAIKLPKVPVRPSLWTIIFFFFTEMDTDLEVL